MMQFIPIVLMALPMLVSFIFTIVVLVRANVDASDKYKKLYDTSVLNAKRYEQSLVSMEKAIDGIKKETVVELVTISPHDASSEEFQREIATCFSNPALMFLFSKIERNIIAEIANGEKLEYKSGMLNGLHMVVNTMSATFKRSVENGTVSRD